MRNLRCYYHATIEDFMRQSAAEIAGVIHSNDISADTRIQQSNKWQNVKSDERKLYLKNAYRVLLTRARQGMVIFIPEGSDTDNTRKREYYDGTYNYLRELGIRDV